MEGYVYVISNKAMAGLVKVGFTTRSPDERAAELDGTHFPYPPVVEYFALVSNAKAVEKEVHRSLRAKRERKE
ncbi:GIY-YIG nuclease family protein [Cupriavidus sp. 8B]